MEDELNYFSEKIGNNKIVGEDSNLCERNNLCERGKTNEIKITAYWEGYAEMGMGRREIQPYLPEEINTSVDTVIIAFLAPAPPKKPNKRSTNWSFGISDATYNSELIRRSVLQLKKSNPKIKILFSLMDTPTTHWTNVDINSFVLNLRPLVTDWNLDGFDIDGESGMDITKFSATFIQLIKTLRSYFPDKIVTYTCYTQSEFDQQIITSCKDDINMIHTMAYMDFFTEMQNLFNWYASIIGNPSKVSIGVCCNTSRSEIQQLGTWLKSISNLRMMLWSLTQDVPQITGYPKDTWFNTIYTSLSNDFI
jgi:hypothetical protein